MSASPDSPGSGSSPCPEVVKLQSFLDGRLTEEQCDTIAMHLESCTTCMAAVTELDGSSASGRSLAKSGEANCQVEDSDLVERAVARAIEASSAAPSPESRFHAGMLVGSYRLVERLGGGGMGVVYLAKHEAMRRRVALKVLIGRLQDDPDSTRRFVNEIRTSAKLAHPRFVKSLDAGEYAGSPYLVMDYLDGVSLSALVRAWGRLPVADVCEIGRQIAEGLQVLSDHKLVHRDLKPSNLMLVTEHSTADGNATDSGPTIKILDFGVARWRESAGMTQAVTLPSLVVGTLEYMAPEQVEASSQVDERADWYSLGATLFKLLIGAAPLELIGHADASPLSKAAHLKSTPAPPIRTLRRDVPRAVARIIDRLLSRDPAKRPTLQEVQQVLTAFAPDADLPRLLRELPESPCSVPMPSPHVLQARLWWRSVQRNLRWPFAAATVLLGVFAFATHYGELRIEVLDEDTNVEIKRGGKIIEVIDTRENRRVRLRPDKYELSVEKSGKKGLELSASEITIRRGTIEIARLKLQPTSMPPVAPPKTKQPSLIGPREPRIVADWRFAQDAKQQPVRDGQMLLPFEGEGWLWDDSGKLQSAHTLEHPRYRKYDAAADRTRENLDGWALQTGNSTGALWCRNNGQLARHRDFSLWCRVKLDRGDLKRDQTLLSVPGDWELRLLQRDGHLDVTAHSVSDWKMDVVKHEHPQTPLTDWAGQWIDIGLTFDGNGSDDHADVVTVYVDGVPRDTWRGVARFGNKSFLHVGCSEANSHVFDGQFDRVVVYEGVVTAETFRQLSRPRLTERACSHGVNNTVFSPDEKLLAMSGGENERTTGIGQDEIELFAMPNLELQQTLKGHGGVVYSLAFSHDGQWLASASADFTARIWDVASGKVRHTLKGHEAAVFSVAISPDDRWLATTGADATVRIWDANTGEPKQVLRHPRGWIWTAVFSPDGKWLATGEGNRTIKLREVTTFREVTTLEGHDLWVRTLAFSPDSKWLYSGSGDKTVKVWNVEKQELKASLEHKHVVQSLDVSPDGRMLVSGAFDHMVRFWDTETLKELPIGGRHAYWVQSVRFAPRTPLVISGCADFAMRVWPVDLPKVEPPAKSNP